MTADVVGNGQEEQPEGAKQPVPESQQLERMLCLGQGWFYLITGIWPLLSIRTFEAITGPKTDRWLVKTVGVLVGVVGGALLLSARRGKASPEMVAIANGSAAGLAAIDVVYSLRGRISKVYLLDALAEAGIIGAWALVRSARRAEQVRPNLFRGGATVPARNSAAE